MKKLKRPAAREPDEILDPLDDDDDDLDDALRSTSRSGSRGAWMRLTIAFDPLSEVGEGSTVEALPEGSGEPEGE